MLQSIVDKTREQVLQKMSMSIYGWIFVREFIRIITFAKTLVIV